MKGIEEHIEQLAFGRTMPRISACLGLYISTDVVFLCEVKMTGGKPTVGHLLRVPVPQAPAARETRVAGTLNTDMLADPEKLAGILKPVLSQVKWGANFVCVSAGRYSHLMAGKSLISLTTSCWISSLRTKSQSFIVAS